MRLTKSSQGRPHNYAWSLLFNESSYLSNSVYDLNYSNNKHYKQNHHRHHHHNFLCSTIYKKPYNADEDP